MAYTLALMRILTSSIQKVHFFIVAMDLGLFMLNAAILNVSILDSRAKKWVDHRGKPAYDTLLLSPAKQQLASNQHDFPAQLVQHF